MRRQASLETMRRSCDFFVGLVRGRKPTWDVIVAVKGKIVEAGGDSIPSRHVGGFRATNTSVG